MLLRPNLTAARLFQYFLPATLTLFMMVTLKRTIDTGDGMPDEFFGLPLPYITGNFGCTDCFAVIISNLLIDLAVYFLLIVLLGAIIEKIGIRLKTHWIAIAIGCLVCAWWLFVFHIVTEESHFQLFNDIDYKTVKTEISFDLL